DEDVVRAARAGHPSRQVLGQIVRKRWIGPISVVTPALDAAPLAIVPVVNGQARRILDLRQVRGAHVFEASDVTIRIRERYQALLCVVLVLSEDLDFSCGRCPTLKRPDQPRAVPSQLDDASCGVDHLDQSPSVVAQLQGVARGALDARQDVVGAPGLVAGEEMPKTIPAVEDVATFYLFEGPASLTEADATAGHVDGKAGARAEAIRDEDFATPLFQRPRETVTPPEPEPHIASSQLRAVAPADAQLEEPRQLDIVTWNREDLAICDTDRVAPGRRIAAAGALPGPADASIPCALPSAL